MLKGKRVTKTFANGRKNTGLILDEQSDKNNKVRVYWGKADKKEHTTIEQLSELIEVL